LLEAVSQPRDAALARARGAVRVEFAAARGTTVLARLGQQSPLRVLLPRPAGSDAVAVLVNTAGGVCSGDRLDTAAAALPGARATVVGQAAERVYRALDRPASLRTRLAIGSNAALHWAPQETLLFDGAKLERRTEVNADEGGRLLAAETLVFGRRAMGERVRRAASAARRRSARSSARPRMPRAPARRRAACSATRPSSAARAS
jgi:urease accessory protein